MTTASAAGDNEKPWPRWRTALASMGHNEPKWSIPFTAANTLYWLPVFWLPRHNAIRDYSIFVWIAILAFSWLLAYAGRLHRRMQFWCQKCIDDHGLINPEAQITKHRPKLRRVHDHRWHQITTYFLFAQLGAVILGVLVLDRHGWFKLPLQILATVLFFGGTIEMLWAANERRIHNWLRPWCPWCHPRRDKDNEATPEPTPDPGEPVKPVLTS